MRAVVQRVSHASVSVDGAVTAKIGRGLLVLLGVAREDGPADAAYIAGKLSRLRVFEDDGGRMNLSLADTGGKALVVSQFTLLGDTGRGNRPSFTAAASPETAEELYLEVAAELERAGIETEAGVFGAMMEVELVGDGPVTLILDSR
ncbi:MAG: D-aminoacyl-tRNA deacylase [Actinomycetota bacterium]